MMGLGWGEMLVIAIVALIAVGPKDLPVMMRNAGRAMGTIRRMSNEFRREIDKAIAAEDIKNASKAISDPISKTRDEISREFNALKNGKVEPSGKIKPAVEGQESVFEEIKAQAGMKEPASGPAATGAAFAGASGAAVTPAAPQPAAPQKPATRKTAAKKPASAKPDAAKSTKAAPKRTAKTKPAAADAEAPKAKPARPRSKKPAAVEGDQ